jgi:RecJ-like exonuclease
MRPNQRPYNAPGGDAAYGYASVQKRRAAEAAYRSMVLKGICLACSGLGRIWLFFHCHRCGGTGRVNYCQACSGKGKGWFLPCGFCQGSGRSQEV